MNSDATDASFNDRSCPLSVSGCCFRLFSRSSSLLFILQSHVDKHPRGTPSSLACGIMMNHVHCQPKPWQEARRAAQPRSSFLGPPCPADFFLPSPPARSDVARLVPSPARQKKRKRERPGHIRLSLPQAQELRPWRGRRHEKAEEVPHSRAPWPSRFVRWPPAGCRSRCAHLSSA